MRSSNIAYLIAGASLCLIARSWMKKAATAARTEGKPRENGCQVIDMALWKEMRGWQPSRNAVS